MAMTMTTTTMMRQMTMSSTWPTILISKSQTVLFLPRCRPTCHFSFFCCSCRSYRPCCVLSTHSCRHRRGHHHSHYRCHWKTSLSTLLHSSSLLIRWIYCCILQVFYLFEVWFSWFGFLYLFRSMSTPRDTTLRSNGLLFLPTCLCLLWAVGFLDESNRIISMKRILIWWRFPCLLSIGWFGLVRIFLFTSVNSKRCSCHHTQIWLVQNHDLTVIYSLQNSSWMNDVQMNFWKSN